ncbi:undecaprenyl-diphosphate phosphatase [Govanella unica]|uniref:Undecaprenyl-diphosphatase n=1 Tax=Govanella unica TaxID=2975056 RepID=A0A9X3Z867_9PROT|nr:undecaprenyl-diphosphate phosphatase [Govania unica]MDA5194719.1 undecaprenyl-diphosphate phosphatase [Govania unica]
MSGVYFDAVLLGIIEAATEFLPVSSTGHLLLAGHFLNFEGPQGRVFEVAIQLGAILAICVLYFQRLWHVLVTLPSDPVSRHFVTTILLAFLPAAVIGAAFHGVIKAYLFSPWVVCWALILGGFAILAIERFRPEPSIRSIDEVRPKTAVAIGFLQCLAMIPGVSRSGATILGALCLGVERKQAAEFSFFLAIPTMFGAVAFDLYKNRGSLTFDDGALIGVGFVTTFVVALVVVRWLVGFISRHGFGLFAWYRIILGGLGLAALATFG